MAPRRATAERSAGWLRAAFCFHGPTDRAGEPVALAGAGDALAMALVDGTGCWSCGLERSRPAAAALALSLESGPLEAAYAAADAALTDVDEADPLEGAPSASAAFAYATPERLRVGWVGDCRPALVRGGAVVWQGAPHTLAEQLRREQPGVAPGPAGGVLLRSMGAHPRGAPPREPPELATLRAWPGDRLLLLSRLAAEALQPEDLVRAVAEAGAAPLHAATALVELALARRGERHPELERAVAVLALLPG